MLLQGAYSAKYRAAQQEKFENLRDEERQEFNVKLEKTKELSRDTNRRRRALEQRRKDYEAGEEKKRREILAQRKKEIQEATEKFQRSNVVKAKKKANFNQPDRSKPSQKVKHESTKYPKTEVNGQPNYPSVEQVLAMLHADRADLIERLVDEESSNTLQTRDYNNTPAQSDASLSTQVQPSVTFCGTNKGAGNHSETGTSDQYVIDQEQLRSEVVGRSQPRLAFGDEINDLTTGVLPTTIRRNSPSGSLSSLDSLDEVPDEVLESSSREILGPAGRQPDMMELEGIIRKAGKMRSGNRVTFNESVTYNDGFTGMLKMRSESSASDLSGVEKQQSYFHLEEQQTARRDKQTKQSPENESACSLNHGANVVISKNSQGSPGYPSWVKSSTGTSGSGFSTILRDYPCVTTADVTPAGNTGDSRTKTVLRNTGNAGGNEVKNPNTTCLTPTPVSSTQDWCGVCVSRNGSSDIVSHGYQTSARKSSHIIKNGTSDKPIEQNAKNGVQNHNGVIGFSTNLNRPNNYKTVENTPLTSTNPVPFTSINASVLKDSLEISHGSITNQPEPSTQSTLASHNPTAVVTHTSPKQVTHTSPAPPTYAPSTESRTPADLEVLPETPLIPVTKKDFLSKALRTTNNVQSSRENSKGSPFLEHERVTTNHDTSHLLHNGNCAGNKCERNDNVSNQNKSHGHIYHQRSVYGTRNNGAIQGYRGIDGLAVNADETAKMNEHESFKQGHKCDPRNSKGTQGYKEINGVSPNDEDAQKSNAYDRGINKQGYGSYIRYSQETLGHNRAVGMDSNDRIGVAQNGYEGDISKQGLGYGSSNYRGYDGHSGTRVIPNTTDVRERNGYEGEEHDSRNGGLVQGYSGRKFSNTEHNSHHSSSTTNRRTQTNKDYLKAGTKNATNRIPVEKVQNGRLYTTPQKAASTAELLKSVQEDIERLTMTPSQPSFSRTYGSTTCQRSAPSGNHKNDRKPTAFDRGRKPTKQKSPNGPKTSSKESERFSPTAKKLHKPAGECGSGVRKQISNVINVKYASNQNGNREYTIPNPATIQKHSLSQDAVLNRLPGAGKDNPDMDSRPLEYYSQGGPPWTNTFEQKQRKNSERLVMLDKTPTDEEINTLWETVRTCLKHEQLQKAASDSVVNSTRHSRSESGPLLGTHYLIDSDRLDQKPKTMTNAFGIYSPGNECYQGSTGSNRSFCRQNSLDSFSRRGSNESVSSLTARKRSLLEQRSQRNERRLTRNQPASRSPVNPQYFQALRGPTASTRGPKKSTSVKTEVTKRPQLSYAEFQAVMQASADLQTRNPESETQRRPYQAVHQPIIMNHRKEPSALSLEEKRLLESLDRLNERLKVQERLSSKLTRGQRKPSTHGSPSQFSAQAMQNNRFSTRSGHRDVETSPSLLSRR